jgi:hypothetical protein
MARQRYTSAEVIKAAYDARGIKTVAARILGCCRMTVERYCRRYVTVNRAFKDARQQVVDKAEEGLWEKLDKKMWPAIRYTLSTLGKDRGYGEGQELEHKGDVTIHVVYDG